MDFSMFLHGYREVSAPGLWGNPNCYHSYGAEETWLQRSMVAQLPFLVAHDGWTTLSGFFTRWECFAVLLPEYFHLKLSERQPLP